MWLTWEGVDVRVDLGINGRRAEGGEGDLRLNLRLGGVKEEGLPLRSRISGRSLELDLEGGR